VLEVNVPDEVGVRAQVDADENGGRDPARDERADEEPDGIGEDQAGPDEIELVRLSQRFVPQTLAARRWKVRRGQGVILAGAWRVFLRDNGPTFSRPGGLRPLFELRGPLPPARSAAMETI